MLGEVRIDQISYCVVARNPIDSASVSAHIRIDWEGVYLLDAALRALLGPLHPLGVAAGAVRVQARQKTDAVVQKLLANAADEIR